MYKISLAIIGILISMVHAEFVLKTDVLQRTEKLLQRSMEKKSLDYVAYEVVGTEKLAVNVDSPAEELDGRYIIQLNSNSRKSKLQDEKGLLQLASKDLKTLFSDDVSNSSKITRVGFEYQQRNDEIEIVGGIVMVHQLVQGLPVRGSSFIFLHYDGLSNLKRIEYNWLKVKKKIAKRTTLRAEPVKFHEKMLKQKTAEISDELVKANMHGELYDAVQSWRMMTDSTGKSVLVPSVTYLGRFEDSGRMRYVTFDIDEFSTDLEHTKTEICTKKGDE